MKQITVNNWSQVVPAMIEVTEHFGKTRPWWRGHANSEWKLIPSLHRQANTDNERNMTFRFRNMAKGRHSHCPPSTDFPGWLFLMQHYRLPTRLLDWSESPLVALFFAVINRNEDDKDGVLWALEPAKFNKYEFGKEEILAGDHQEAEPVFREAFAPIAKGAAEKTFAIFPIQSDPRQLMQQSVFTIHGKKTPLNEYAKNEEYMAKIIIPKDLKKAFRGILFDLGINRSSLFPDLENLAKEITEMGFNGQVGLG